MTIRNTSAADPTEHLVGSMIQGSTDYILGQEAQGQAQVVNSDRLPTDLGLGQDARSKYEALGFVFGEPDAADPMFTPVTLPEGWSRARTEHSMWSKILDERGVERVSVFYKAAFYDRSAHASLCNVGWTAANHYLYADEEEPVEHWDVFTDDERADFVTGLRRMIVAAQDHPQIYGEHAARATAWLTANGHEV